MNVTATILFPCFEELCTDNVYFLLAALVNDTECISCTSNSSISNVCKWGFTGTNIPVSLQSTAETCCCLCEASAGGGRHSVYINGEKTWRNVSFTLFTAPSSAGSRKTIFTHKQPEEICWVFWWVRIRVGSFSFTFTDAVAFIVTVLQEVLQWNPTK